MCNPHTYTTLQSFRKLRKENLKPCYHRKTEFTQTVTTCTTVGFVQCKPEIKKSDTRWSTFCEISAIFCRSDVGNQSSIQPKVWRSWTHPPHAHTRSHTHTHTHTPFPSQRVPSVRSPRRPRWEAAHVRPWTWCRSSCRLATETESEWEQIYQRKIHVMQLWKA